MQELVSSSSCIRRSERGLVEGNRGDLSLFPRELEGDARSS